MLVLSFWSILFFVFLHFTDVLTTMWNVEICFLQAYYYSAAVTLNNESKTLSSIKLQKCFNNNFELISREKPSFIEVNEYTGYKAVVQNKDLQKMYAFECQSQCVGKQKLEEWIHWNLEVIHSEINDSYDYSIEIRPYGENKIMFKTNSRTSNTSFFLPTKMNRKSRMELLTTGKFWPEKIVFVQNEDLQETYAVEVLSNCSENQKLEEWIHWNLEVIHSEINDSYDYSIAIRPYGENKIMFKTNSRTSNTSFFLPTKMNRKSRIELLTTGKFWPEKTIRLKNLETSIIYSCSYILKQRTHYHECSQRNDLVWIIELTTHSKLISLITQVKIFVGVTSNGTNSSQGLTFRKLAYFPTFSAPTNIGTIVMTRILTGEEYGCVNIHKTIPAKYSCKLQKSKNWLLKVISPEEEERKFFVEIIQDKLSSFSRNLTWKRFTFYGDGYIMYFNLKTYEDDEITSLKLHFFDKSLRISEISLTKNHPEYKFKTNEERKLQNSSVTEFTRITKEKGEKIQSTKSCHIMNIMKIVIGSLAVIISFLIIIITILRIRYNTLRNSINKVNTSTIQDVAEYDYFTMQTNTPVHISEPSQGLSLQSNSLDIAEYCLMQSPNSVEPSEGSTSSYLNPQDVCKSKNPISEKSAQMCNTPIYEELT
ncbi:uncharacterized protein LOC106873081 isoform X2 [Octopus bimaculoides]|uniref:uncharacterized protein LOC106873081 isoform X2 n=1 Tax=Octopus bimaculoides TaxID=37653 RepID=UPI00071E45E3|nr:uncharacterized protein LOC106873081 isoform X2 [Octopus bimaculoides]|eukprot:XP_014775805.1 PREDICTED: uncharacterized protein LOC106873081 isoform X2 [Octopus bimaculoides]